ncbi:MAG TPA: hypothetical protein VKY73_12335 [Polyangiaceae bacterium]|nr:hypothetical protein [Polyangiaceae bacterium]
MKGGALVLAVALSAACATELEDPARFTGSALGAGGSAGGVTGSGGTTGSGGSAGTAGSGGSGPDTATCWLNIVRTQCLICHASAATPGKIDLSGTGPQIAARLRDVPPTNDAVADPESCLPGEKLIDPNNVDNSVLLKRLNGTQSCGSRMPSGLSALSAAQLTCVRTWVESVAASN